MFQPKIDRTRDTAYRSIFIKQYLGFFKGNVLIIDKHDNELY